MAKPGKRKRIVKKRSRVAADVKHVPVVAVDLDKGKIHVIPVPRAEVEKQGWWKFLFGVERR